MRLLALFVVVILPVNQQQSIRGQRVRKLEICDCYTGGFWDMRGNARSGEITI